MDVVKVFCHFADDPEFAEKFTRDDTENGIRWNRKDHAEYSIHACADHDDQKYFQRVSLNSFRKDIRLENKIIQ